MNWKHRICIASLCFISFAAHATKPMIAAGSSSSLFLNGDGSVWVAGRASGQSLGATSPLKVLPLNDIVAVATTWGTHMALLADGTLWGVGSNLGDGTPQYYSQPQPVPGLPAIGAFSMNDQVLALGRDGTVWAWGKNDRGQLGDGSRTDRYSPVQLTGLNNIAKVSAGPTSSLALGTDGSVWVWGWTCCGAAGNGHDAGVETDPEMYHLVPTQVPGVDQVIAISAGTNHHTVLRADGTVWTWGVGAHGWSGNGTLASNLVPARVPGLDQIIAIRQVGTGASVALKSDGTVWAWGNNAAGQLGVSALTYSTVPIQVPGASDVIAIAAGDAHVLAMRLDGTVLAWGLNSYGQLGDNTLQSRAQPLAVAGPGGSGQLNLLQPVPAGFNQLPQATIELSALSGKAPLTLSAGVRDASDADGSITAYLWSSSDGQQASGPSATFVFNQAGTYNIDLLVEDNSGGRGSDRRQIVVAPAAVSLSTTAAIGLGKDNGIALANDGRILTWGLNGLLGYYDGQVQSRLPSANSLPLANGIVGATALATGSAHVHVLRADGTVFGWGINSVGEVGSGSIENGVMQPEQLPNLPPIQALAAGAAHGMALSGDGRVFSWGKNTDGQLGLGDSQNRFQPVEVIGLSSVLAIRAAGNFSVALKSDGTVWAWGDNMGMELGDGTQISRNRPIQVAGLSGIAKVFVTDFAIFAQQADGTVWVTGNPPTAISGDPGPHQGARRLPEFDAAVSIVGGNRHMVVVKADGSVWSGGSQVAMALGFADSADVAGLKQLPGISDAAAAVAGESNSVVLRRDGTVYAWGLNNFGQIGDGTLALRATPVLVVNETADGFLDLIPGTDFDAPPSVGVPFFAVAAGDISGSKATVYTRAKFNDGDVGKSGKVFVTAAVPPGSLVAASSPMSAAGSSAGKPVSSAATGSTAYVLVNLTDLGWKEVTNGQLLPYATGVLDDQLSAQKILDNTDTSNLKGAQFCLGYGIDAAQMVATGTMRVVASIPDPNASGAAAASCIVAGPPVSYSLALPQGWSLLGNSLNQSLTVPALFNDVNSVTSVWKWDANALGWQFYTPLMDATALQTYAASKGYAVLATINPGEGYWVNAKAPPIIGAQSGDSFILTGMNLARGWNMVATGNDISPSEFNTNLKSSAVPASLKTLWAWDNPQSAWYFYAPSLEAQGGTALSGYVANKGYLDFSTTNKKLGNGTGFWVNR